MADRKVATGVYRTRYGWRVFVRVNGILKPKRIKDPDHELGLVAVKQRRQDWSSELRRRDDTAPPETTPGTFEDDVLTKYLPAKRAMPGIKERRRQMRIWIAEFGERVRHTIQSWEIAAVRDRWLTEGPRLVCLPWAPDDVRPASSRGGRWVEVHEPLSASQVNKRLRALENMWTTLDGRHAPNPVREVDEPAEPEGEARGLPYDVVEAILAKMPDRGRPVRGETPGDVNLTKLRLRAIAYTGFSHSELMGIGRKDLRLDGPLPSVWIAGRRKGKTTSGTEQPLTTQGAAALRALVNAGGLGTFSTSAMWVSFQRACAKLDLVGLTPYDLRHSFASEILEKTGGNLPATQLLMRHRSQKTTLRYGKRAIDPVRAAAIQQVRDRGGFGELVTSKVTTTRKRRVK